MPWLAMAGHGDSMTGHGDTAMALGARPAGHAMAAAAGAAGHAMADPVAGRQATSSA